MKPTTLKKPCQRDHQRDQEEVISVCLNKDCQIRLSCANCQRDGYHKDHQVDLYHFDFLPHHLDKEIHDYQQAGIPTLINQRKQEFQKAKAGLLHTLDLLEADFLEIMSRISEADEFICESIQMVETKDFQPFQEIHAQVLVDLKETFLVERLKKLAATTIIQELQTFSLSLGNLLQSTKINNFLRKHCGYSKQIDTFLKNRLNYNCQEMRLIIEENVQEMIEDNSFYLGGFQNHLKHGRGILINKELKEIIEGVWENNILKWGSLLGKCGFLDYAYVGSFTDGKQKKGRGMVKYSNGENYEGEWEHYQMQGKGIYRWPNGERYEGGYLNGQKEGLGIFYYPSGDYEVGLYQNGLKVGEHKVYKATTTIPFKINIYRKNGKLRESKMQ